MVGDDEDTCAFCGTTYRYLGEEIWVVQCEGCEKLLCDNCRAETEDGEPLCNACFAAQMGARAEAAEAQVAALNAQLAALNMQAAAPQPPAAPQPAVAPPAAPPAAPQPAVAPLVWRGADDVWMVDGVRVKDWDGWRIGMHTQCFASWHRPGCLKTRVLDEEDFFQNGRLKISCSVCRKNGQAQQ